MMHRMILALALSVLIMPACDRSYTPKPMGYVRVHYPEKKYTLFDSAAPFRFEVPEYTEVVPSTSANAEPWWYNIRYPEYNGTIHLSYKNPGDHVDELIGDTRTLVYKHSSQADGIVEIPYVDTSRRKYGILYELKGNVASAVQFFLTDSTEHFLRGALYFRTTPNRDSLNPVINFVEEDIEHLMETLEWK